MAALQSSSLGVSAHPGTRNSAKSVRISSSSQGCHLSLLTGADGGFLFLLTAENGIVFLIVGNNIVLFKYSI